MSTMDLVSFSRYGGCNCGKKCRKQHLAGIYNIFGRDLMASVNVVIGSVTTVMMVVNNDPGLEGLEVLTCVCRHHYK